jgi:hypothetical protein
MSRKDLRSGHSFAMPLLGIAMLLAFYCVVMDWNQLPALISATLSNISVLH